MPLCRRPWLIFYIRSLCIRLFFVPSFSLSPFRSHFDVSFSKLRVDKFALGLKSVAAIGKWGALLDLYAHSDDERLSSSRRISLIQVPFQPFFSFFSPFSRNSAFLLLTAFSFSSFFLFFSSFFCFLHSFPSSRSSGSSHLSLSLLKGFGSLHPSFFSFTNILFIFFLYLIWPWASKRRRISRRPSSQDCPRSPLVSSPPSSPSYRPSAPPTQLFSKAIYKIFLSPFLIL